MSEVRMRNAELSNLAQNRSEYLNIAWRGREYPWMVLDCSEWSRLTQVGPELPNLDENTYKLDRKSRSSPKLVLYPQGPIRALNLRVFNGLIQFFRILNENTAAKDEKTEPESSVEHFFRIFDPLRMNKIGPLTLGGAGSGLHRQGKTHMWYSLD